MAFPYRNPSAQFVALQPLYLAIRDSVLALPEVSGIDIGTVYDDEGRATGALAIRVHMIPLPEGSGAVHALSEGRVYDGIAVQVVTAQYREERAQHQDRNASCDPLQPGINISNVGLTAGTLGLIAYDRTGRACAVSSAHVLGLPGCASRKIVQPSGPASPVVAMLRCSYRDETGDAAFAELSGTASVCREQLETSVVIPSVALPDPEVLVEKSGVGSGCTSGQIESAGRFKMYDGSLGMDGWRIILNAAGTYTKPGGVISHGGDSGAAWYTVHGHVGIGLHVGSDTCQDRWGRTAAVACSLPAALDRFDLTVSPPDA
jgi:hypothetical protein